MLLGQLKIKISDFLKKAIAVNCSVSKGLAALPSCIQQKKMSLACGAQSNKNKS